MSEIRVIHRSQRIRNRKPSVIEYNPFGIKFTNKLNEKNLDYDCANNLKHRKGE